MSSMCRPMLSRHSRVCSSWSASDCDVSGSPSCFNERFTARIRSLHYTDTDRHKHNTYIQSHKDIHTNNQSINQFISRHSTEARATVRLCQIKEKCLKTDLKCVNGWSSSTVQWKRVSKSRSSNRETTCSSVQVVQRNWQKLLCGWSQQTILTVGTDGTVN